MNHHHDRPELDPELDRALASLRDGLRREPDEATATRHLAAMRRAASEEAPMGWWASLRERSTPRRNPMPALTPRWLAVSTAAVFGFTGGLAAADVLPDPAQNIVAETVSRVGIDLPDPDDRRHGDDVEGADETETETDDTPNNDHGKTVSSIAHDDSLTGCEKGQAVRGVASSKSQGQGNGHSDGHDPCSRGDDGLETDSEDEGESGDENESQEGGGPPSHLGDDDAPGNSGSTPGRGRGGPPSSTDADDDGPGNSGGNPGHGHDGSGDDGSGDDED